MEYSSDEEKISQSDDENFVEIKPLKSALIHFYFLKSVLKSTRSLIKSYAIDLSSSPFKYKPRCIEASPKSRIYLNLKIEEKKKQLIELIEYKQPYRIHAVDEIYLFAMNLIPYTDISKFLILRFPIKLKVLSLWGCDGLPLIMSKLSTYLPNALSNVSQSVEIRYADFSMNPEIDITHPLNWFITNSMNTHEICLMYCTFGKKCEYSFENTVLSVERIGFHGCGWEKCDTLL